MQPHFLEGARLKSNGRVSVLHAEVCVPTIQKDCMQT